MSNQGTNRYGLDVAYLRKNLKILQRDIDNYTPDEMIRALDRLSAVCKTTKKTPHPHSHGRLIDDYQ